MTFSEVKNVSSYKWSPEEFIEQVIPKCIKLDRTKGWDRIIQFYITDLGEWYLEVKDQKATMTKGKHPEPDLEFTMDFDTLYGLFTGEVFAPTAISKGKMKAKGPMTDQMMFPRIMMRLREVGEFREKLKG